jgi:uncharacterized protein (TIGR02246 family)
MKRSLIALLLVPSLVIAAEDTAQGAPDPQSATEKPSNPMAGWKPPKLTSEAKDKQEIQALLKRMETAGKKGDLEAAASLVDFPVMMLTDASSGQAMGEAWDRDRWTEVMAPFYEKPMEGMRVTHKPTIFLLSDSLASVQDAATMTMGQGGKPVTVRNSMLLVRRDGQWRVKAMAEGGWGDMMKASQGSATGEQGTPSEGTGSGASTPPAPGAGAPGPGGSGGSDQGPAGEAK